MDILSIINDPSGTSPKSFSDQLCDKTCEFFLRGANGFDIAGGLTDFVDSIMRSVFNEITESPAYCDLALIAVGGYGRREMMPFSDIDIMLLARENSNSAKEAAQKLLYRLWDIGLNISHSFRTLKDCIDDSVKDIQTRTALLDCRFLIGDKTIFSDFLRDCYPKIIMKNKREFISSLLIEADRRHKTTGESLYLLEPNVKECRGGLRDIHTISWLSKAEFRISEPSGYIKFLSERQFRDFISAHNFLLKLRGAIHICSRRKNDSLIANIHNSVALALGFRNTKRFFASEIMMRSFYRKSKAVSDAFAKISALCGGRYYKTQIFFAVRKITNDFFLSKNEIIVKNPEVLKNTGKIMEAFKVFSDTGKMFSPQVEELLKNNAFLISREGRNSRDAINNFRHIMRGKRVYETLKIMHDTLVLDRFIPEFGRIRHLVILEAFHRYTVDEHTLIAIKNLENLRRVRGGALGDLSTICEGINLELLYAAILFHDIGKGILRKHEEAGYLMIRGILERLLYSPEERQVIEFLVRNHIVLSKLALSRDIDAPETIIRMAEIAQNESNLAMLYIMTYADMSAVNPFFWNEWKAMMLAELYRRTLQHLRGVVHNPYCRLSKEAAAFAEKMSKRYLLSNTAEEIERDYELSKIACNEDVATLIEEKGTAAELVIISFKVGSLFQIASGVLSRRRLNIVHARMFTGEDKIIICKIVVSNWKDMQWEGLYDCIKDELKMASFTGQYKESITSDFKQLKYAENRGLLLEIDNETAENQTILDIIIPDQIGLLNKIATRLQTFKIDILSAMINTEDGMAHDVFYLQKRGGKLPAEDCEKVLAALCDV